MTKIEALPTGRRNVVMTTGECQTVKVWCTLRIQKSLRKNLRYEEAWLWERWKGGIMKKDQKLLSSYSVWFWAKTPVEAELDFQWAYGKIVSLKIQTQEGCYLSTKVGETGDTSHNAMRRNEIQRKMKLMFMTCRVTCIYLLSGRTLFVWQRGSWWNAMFLPRTFLGKLWRYEEVFFTNRRKKKDGIPCTILVGEVHRHWILRTNQYWRKRVIHIRRKINENALVCSEEVAVEERAAE